MQPIPHDAVALLLMVFALGFKHGLDPDHLATIDGLTRFNALLRPRISRWSGVFFSLGHGLVVTAVAAAVAHLAHEWAVPAWIEHLGVWVSIVFLVALGIANFVAVFRADPGEVIAIAGVKSRFFGGFSRISHPVLIAAVGALFALSFDTLSQAAVFSLAASKMAGWAFSVLIGIVFMFGMIATDGINGLWMARLMRRADHRARVASRVMSLAVAGLSFAIAGYGLIRYFAPDWIPANDGLEAAYGLGVVAIMVASFVIAMRLAQPKPAASRARPA